MSTTTSQQTPLAEEPVKLDHVYDGIEEFDNPLPGWWKWLFIVTILFCFPYWIYYHGGTSGRSIQDNYAVALAANQRLQFEEIGDLQPNAATIVEYMHKDSWRRVGKIVFQTHCVSCHGREGEGQVGPNLTDDYYKNVNNIEDIASVVNNGAGAGAMPKWSNRLHPNEIVLVSSYVASLRGEHLSGPRGEEGKEIPPWPEPKPETENDAEQQE